MNTHESLDNFGTDKQKFLAYRQLAFWCVILDTDVAVTTEGWADLNIFGRVLVTTFFKQPAILESEIGLKEYKDKEHWGHSFECQPLHAKMKSTIQRQTLIYLV